MQKIIGFFNNTSLEKEKILNEKIVSLTETVNSLNEKIIDLQHQLDVLAEHNEQLDKGYAAMTYIVESHNALLVELTGLSKTSSTHSSTSGAGGLTRLPEIYSGNKKDKKPN